MTALTTSRAAAGAECAMAPHGLSHATRLYSPTVSPPSWAAGEDLREHFRRIASLVRREDSGSIAVGLCSTSAAEGTSWVAAGLAMAFAEGRHDVALIDAQSMRPAQIRQFKAVAAAGVRRPAADAGEELLLSRICIADAAQSAGAATPTKVALLVAELRSGRVVIVDLEPLRDSSQVLGLGGVVDHVVLVVEAERERREVVARSVEAMNRAGHTIAGAVLNKRVRHIPNFIYRWL